MPFVVQNRRSGDVLDDKYMSTEPGNPIIDWPLSNGDSPNQHWDFVDDRLRNVYSKLFLTFKDLTPESLATQEEYDDQGDGQKFKYDNGTISLVEHDDLVVGGWDQDVKIVPRDENDQGRQWDLRD